MRGRDSSANPSGAADAAARAGGGMCKAALRFSVYIKADAPKDPRYLRIGRRLRERPLGSFDYEKKDCAMKTVGGDPRRDLKIHILEIHRFSLQFLLKKSDRRSLILGLLGGDERRDRIVGVTTDFFRTGFPETGAVTQFLRNSESEEDFVKFVRA